jgi:hypothetical protein
MGDVNQGEVVRPSRGRGARTCRETRHGVRRPHVPRVRFESCHVTLVSRDTRTT